MTRVIFSFLSFVTVFVVETSFLSSLPSVFSLIPLVFAFGVFLLQHQGLFDGFIWIGLYGLLLQTFDLSTIPFAFFSYTIAAVGVLFTARNIFSNRSLYGVVASGIAGYFILLFLHGCFLLFLYLFGDSFVSWKWFVWDYGQKILLFSLTTCVLFILAWPTRNLFPVR